jgi:hypothetical protein
MRTEKHAWVLFFFKCGKNTDISYGPWVERQRDLWMKFFFPWDFQQLQPTKDNAGADVLSASTSASNRKQRRTSSAKDPESEGGVGSVEFSAGRSGPGSGVRRQPHSFDLKISLLEQSSIDILFSKQTETQAVHMRVNPGSYLDITVPLLVDSAGYTTVINGQFLFLETTTGLSVSYWTQIHSNLHVTTKSKSNQNMKASLTLQYFSVHD